MGLMRLATELVNRGGIDQEVYGALRDIIPLANRAVHGENVEVSDAEDLARLGVSVLQIIRENTLGQLRSDPGRVTITERERDDYLHRRKYRVKTIVPLSTGPYKNEYVMSQKELDQFLEGYDEFAEFLVAIEAEEDGQK